MRKPLSRRAAGVALSALLAVSALAPLAGCSGGAADTAEEGATEEAAAEEAEEERDPEDPADEETAAAVQEALDGESWEFNVDGVDYTLEFEGTEDFTVTMGFGDYGVDVDTEMTGTYEVTYGYIVCSYDETSFVAEIPYTLEGSKVEMDPAPAWATD